MNVPERPPIPGPWPDVLAGYADGELTPEERAPVERWLASNPQARRELQAQRQLSPENWRLWQKVEPPLPGEELWNGVQEAVGRAIAEGEGPPVSGRPATLYSGRRRAAFHFAAGLAAAAAVLLALGAVHQWTGRIPPAPAQPRPEIARTAPEPPEDDPLAGLTVLAIARNDEIVLEQVEGNTGDWLPVGHPLLPGPIVLVSADEVELVEAEDHPAWPSGGPKLRGGPGGAPMIFATGSR